MTHYLRRVVRGYFIFLMWLAAATGLLGRTLLWLMSVWLVLLFTFGAMTGAFSCLILGHPFRAIFVLVEDVVLAIAFFAAADILCPFWKSKRQWVKPKPQPAHAPEDESFMVAYHR